MNKEYEGDILEGNVFLQDHFWYLLCEVKRNAYMTKKKKLWKAHFKYIQVQSLKMNDWQTPNPKEIKGLSVRELTWGHHYSKF